jgi:hypothetical protein
MGASLEFSKSGIFKSGIFKFGVIVRESGRSGTPRRLGSIAAVGGYWMPRIRGA